MAEIRDWQRNREMWIRILEKRTGEGVDEWNRRVRAEGFDDESSLRAWLTGHGVTGYARTLLVMERFGYPDFLRATADELIREQYADRPQLLPILDAIVDAAAGLGEVVVQARKTYVSLVSPRRTFARVKPTTTKRVDLCLRLDGQQAVGRLLPSKIHETMKVQIGLTAPEDMDPEVLEWLQRAYDENR